MRCRLFRSTSLNSCKWVFFKCKYLPVDDFQMQLPCRIEAEEKQQQPNELMVGAFEEETKFRTLWMSNSITYLWRPMRLCWWVRPRLAFRSWFPDFLWEYLPNVGWWFWFLHVNNACVFLFVTENGVFSPATCCVFLFQIRTKTRTFDNFNLLKHLNLTFLSKLVNTQNKMSIYIDEKCLQFNLHIRKNACVGSLIWPRIFQWKLLSF